MLTVTESLIRLWEPESLTSKLNLFYFFKLTPVIQRAAITIFAAFIERIMRARGKI